MGTRELQRGLNELGPMHAFLMERGANFVFDPCFASDVCLQVFTYIDACSRRGRPSMF